MVADLRLQTLKKYKKNVKIKKISNISKISNFSKNSKKSLLQKYQNFQKKNSKISEFSKISKISKFQLCHWKKKKIMSIKKILLGYISIWKKIEATFMSKPSFLIFQLFGFFNSDSSIFVTYFRHDERTTHVHPTFKIYNCKIWQIYVPPKS